MRTLAMAVAVLALLAVPAQAQMGGGKRGHKSDDTKGENKKPKVDDKAYQGALKRISRSQGKVWSMGRDQDAWRRKTIVEIDQLLCWSGVGAYHDFNPVTGEEYELRDRMLRKACGSFVLMRAGELPCDPESRRTIQSW
jgi:hypothetical protein